ncbi:MAG: cell division protein SepF [Firmicutes bacterium]|jgi:cell division inhibitor SepF|nr:cell division protein SepF [Bacillota bacterium]
MSVRFMDKMLSFMGFEEEPDLEVEDKEHMERPQLEEVPTGRKKGQLVSIPGRQTQTRVMVVAPTSYDGVEDVANYLKNGRAVIACLDEIDRDLAKRIVDFMSGTTYALDGSVRRVAEGVFLFAPAHILVEVDPSIDLREKKMSWVTGNVTHI